MLTITDPFIARIIAFLREQGAPAWAVGGFVRDRLLQQIGAARPPRLPATGKARDLDVIVPDGGISLARAVSRHFKGSFFVLDRERDVARAVLHDDFGQPIDVDVARLRAPTLTEDLAYRDFTVNAMAADLTAGGDELPVIDPFAGLDDVRHGVLRTVSEGAFVEDPLRMLRAVRQSVELGFTIEDATYLLIRRDAPLLAKVAAERVRDELVRIVAAPGAWQHVRLLAALQLLQPVLPELAALQGVQQSHPHYLDVFDHTRAVLAHVEGIVAWLWPASGYARPTAVPGDPVVIAATARWDELARALEPYAARLCARLELPLAGGRTRRDWLFWCALAHDWGKAVTGSAAPDGRIHFYDHDRQGAALAETRARALAFAAGEAAYLSHMVAVHMRSGHLARDYPPSRRALYHFFRDAGGASADCILFSLADRMATHGVEDPSSLQAWERDLECAGLALASYFGETSATEAGGPRLVIPDPVPLLDGNQIMAEFGLRPGPAIGTLLEGLREAQAVGEVATVEQARSWLANHVSF